MDPNTANRRQQATGVIAGLLMMWASGLHAADDPAVRREREQLQRTRAALRAADEQRQALEAEKAGWATDRQRLAAQMARVRANETQAERRLQREIDELRDAHLHDEVLVAALRDVAAEASAAARQRETALTEQLAQLRRNNAEQLQLVRAIAGLLERSTGTLTAAQSSNDRMHAAGLAAIEAFRRELGTEELSLTDPLGLRAVRRENQSDTLRDALDKQRVNTSRP